MELSILGKITTKRLLMSASRDESLWWHVTLYCGWHGSSNGNFPPQFPVLTDFSPFQPFNLHVLRPNLIQQCPTGTWGTQESYMLLIN